MSAARLLSVGARGPLGMTALQVAMGARARQLVPRTLGWRDKRGRRIAACVSAAPDPSVAGSARLAALAAGALTEAASGRLREPVPVFLALPEAERPDAVGGEHTLDALVAQSDVPIDRARSRIFAAGHAGVALALEAALAEGPEVLVGGVDSYLHPGVLRWLDEDCRLHAPDAEDGLLPSEGAAFALLRAGARKKSETPLAELVAAASAREPTVHSEEPNLALAMTEIVHRLVDGCAAPPAWVMSDVNGQRHRVREWSMVRVRASFADPLFHERLPDGLGDVGAASGALALALAATWWRSGCAPAGRVLVLLRSEGAERGAFVCEAPR